MTTLQRLAFIMIFAIHVPAVCSADERDAAKPVPSSRQSMLSALDRLKSRTARLPLPDPVADESSTDSRSLGVVNNGRMRALYLPEELARQSRGLGQGNRGSDEDYRFATELFWIVSRVNNCHYCLGHQEDKLLKIGVPESTLLLLDTDWSKFTAKQQAALAFARDLTYRPYQLKPSDLDSLREHFSSEEILEIAFLIGRYNATNRWTDSLGIPQESHRRFESELDAPDLERPSVVVVPISADRAIPADVQLWQERLESERSASVLRKRWGEDGDNTTAMIDRLLVTTKSAGQGWADQWRDAGRTGKLAESLKAKIAFVAAVQDHAWAMQDHALAMLAEQGMDAQAAFALLDDSEPTDATSLALAFVVKLTTRPQAITDGDLTALQTDFDSHEIAEIVYHTGLAAMLNRLTIVATLVSSR